MILDPHELRLLSHKMDSASAEAFEKKLTVLHNAHLMNNHCTVLIPRFWSETIFHAMEEMLKEFPNIKFGSLIETKSRLRMYTIPTAQSVEKMKVELYNKIDTLVLESIDRLLEGNEKPFFMT